MTRTAPEMNLFKDNSAPWILVVLVAVIGFYVTHVVEELRAGRTLVYRFDDDGDRVTLTLWNASRERVLSNLDLQITCADPPCFAGDDERGFYRMRITAPFAVQDIDTDPPGNEIVPFRVTLLPAARFQLVLVPDAFARERFLLFYAPQGTPKPLLILPSWSLSGFMALNYFRILSGALLAAVLVLLIYLGFSLHRLLTRTETSDGIPTYRVSLSRDRRRDRG